MKLPPPPSACYNARGISKSKTVEFASTSVINRVTREISDENELLADRVDFEVDRVAGSKNVNFVSARNVSDIVRTATLGIKGRMTKPRERVYKDQQVYAIADSYFDTLVASPPARRAFLGDAEPQDLRGTSLLASPTVLRVLARVFHNLAVDMEGDMPTLLPLGRGTAEAFFESLAPLMTAPVLPGSPWMSTGVFPDEGAWHRHPVLRTSAASRTRSPRGPVVARRCLSSRAKSTRPCASS